jgi:hypothetical protein
MPDLRGFGIFWIDRGALAAAYGMQGAFNRVALKLAPGASERAAIDGVSRLLSPYGGREAHGRAEQTSHTMLDNEIKQQRVLGTVLPAIFLGVAAFPQRRRLKARVDAARADRRAEGARPHHWRGLPEAPAVDRADR